MSGIKFQFIPISAKKNLTTKITTNKFATKHQYVTFMRRRIMLNLSAYSKSHSFEYCKHVNRENETRSDNVEGRNN